MYYNLFDGRYVLNPDRAIVLECCTELDEAIRCINDYGADTCLVQMNDDAGTEKLLYALLGRYVDPEIVRKTVAVMLAE